METIRKPDELIYWQLSNGDTWRLRPCGLGRYQVTNETNDSDMNDSVTLDKARELVRLLNLTITDEL